MHAVRTNVKDDGCYCTGSEGTKIYARYQPSTEHEVSVRTDVRRIFAHDPDLNNYTVTENTTVNQEVRFYEGPVKLVDASGMAVDLAAVAQTFGAVYLAANDFRRDHTTIIMIDDLLEETSFSLRIARHFEGVPSDGSNRSTERATLKNYSGPFHAVNDYLGGKRQTIMDKHTLKEGSSGTSNLPRRDTRDSHGLRGFWDWPIVSDVARIMQQGLDVFEGRRTP